MSNRCARDEALKTTNNRAGRVLASPESPVKPAPAQQGRHRNQMRHWGLASQAQPRGPLRGVCQPRGQKVFCGKRLHSKGLQCPPFIEWKTCRQRPPIASSSSGPSASPSSSSGSSAVFSASGKSNSVAGRHLHINPERKFTVQVIGRICRIQKPQRIFVQNNVLGFIKK
jgi:hypothetical protein